MDKNGQKMDKVDKKWTNWEIDKMGNLDNKVLEDNSKG
jgi:hypothetical protein